jgi:hypothetical protein
MPEHDAHLSDEELVLAADGEISTAQERHLDGCQVCHTRRRELENAVAAFARARPRQLDAALPASHVARARLRAGLAEIAGQPTGPRPWLGAWLRPWQAVALGALALVCICGILRSPRAVSDVPSRQLTPGAARAMDREELCNSALPKNQPVPADLRQRVFQAYGIANADPRMYEVDYLITPALGGANDIRNLWPQRYLSTVWNARVKDELEDRLRELVCGGRLDLAEAQRDISTDWIAAYKKYFGTDRPVR